MSKTILITGSSGFFGQIVTRYCLENKLKCIGLDIEPNDIKDTNFTFYQMDLIDFFELKKVCISEGVTHIIHCAAKLAHDVKDEHELWESNVDGTRNLAEIAKQCKIKSFIFISSNCLWGHNFNRPVTEADEPKPVEIYGHSKWEAEKVLKNYEEFYRVIIFRCPTIIDEGRLGLLSILFEFLNENRHIWVLGGGKNKYQFIYAKDFAKACFLALDYKQSDIFNIGSDHVKSFYEVYSYVIKQSQKTSKIRLLPKTLTLLLMKVAYWLRISPLGPYQYKMIAEDFLFDTTKIKQQLGWKPTLTNEKMLLKSYEYYQKNINEIKQRSNVSAHRKTAKMGIIRLLKWMS